MSEQKPRRWFSFSLLLFNLGLTLMFGTYGVYGLATGREIITGHKYDGMGGMAPILALILAAFTGLVALIVFLIRRYWCNRAK